MIDLQISMMMSKVEISLPTTTCTNRSTRSKVYNFSSTSLCDPTLIDPKFLNTLSCIKIDEYRMADQQVKYKYLQINESMGKE